MGESGLPQGSRPPWGRLAEPEPLDYDRGAMFTGRGDLRVSSDSPDGQECPGDLCLARQGPYDSRTDARLRTGQAKALKPGVVNAGRATPVRAWGGQLGGTFWSLPV